MMLRILSLVVAASLLGGCSYTIKQGDPYPNHPSPPPVRKVEVLK